MISNQTEVEIVTRLRPLLRSQEWRLSSLYFVIDKEGHDVPFRLNWAQRSLFRSMHYLNVILKARQLGFSTFIAIFLLDVCVFNSNTSAGIVDATIDAAKDKLEKIRFGYQRLPLFVRLGNPIVSDNKFEIVWRNGSSVSVGTSHRGGTFQYLHISEYGKICAKFPEKAREIATGALNTIQAGQMAFIESTAEGQEGRFFDICQTAQSKLNARVPMTPLDFKFHFYPWWKAKEYQIDPAGVVYPAHFVKYFAELAEKHGIELTEPQKAWYVKKAETQQGDMKREFPSTPAEAFEAAVEGAIYGPQMERAEIEGRIGLFPAKPGAPVHTFWDIGVSKSDATSIWFAQIMLGPKIRLVGFYENFGEGLPHYISAVRELYARNKWLRGPASDKANFGSAGATYDVFPHDIRVKEWGTGLTRIEEARAGGFNAIKGVEMALIDGINAMRATLAHCEFDAGPCAEGVKHLKNYRYEWNERLGTWANEPRHDSASHGADAARTLATSWQRIIPSLVTADRKSLAKPDPLAPMMHPANVERLKGLADGETRAKPPEPSQITPLSNADLVKYLQLRKRRTGRGLG